MKKINLLLTFVLILFVFSIDVVYAEEEQKKVMTYEDLSDLSLKENDYEISCTYSDGGNLVISRNDVVVSNLSNSTSSSSNSNIGFYFAEGQRNSMNNTTDISYNHDNILKDGHCPSKLYVYRVEGKHTSDIDDDNTTTKNNDEGEDDEKSDSFFYSTEDDVEKAIAGTHQGGFLWLWSYSNAELLSDRTAALVSEQAFLVTTKNSIICDYETPFKEGDTGKKNPLMIYMFKNISFMETGGYLTPLSDVLKSCPASTGDDEAKKVIYVNDPTAKTVGGGNLMVSSKYYNAIRFNYSDTNSSCQKNNNGTECTLYNYIGSRTNDGLLEEDKDSVCDVLGSELVEQIQSIATMLQIIVPTLVVILTSVDIGKIVLAGNVDEELPKKKKIIIIRFIVMIIFLFAPLISKIIITLLNDTGVVHIGDIDCIFK